MTTQLSIDAIRDAEDDQLAEYMGGRLSDIDQKRFEKRLIDDAEFFHRMAPFLSVLYPIEPSPLELQIRQRVEARRAAHRRATALRADRVRRLEGLVAALTTVTLPVKGFAAATVAATLLVSAQLAGVFTSAPAPLYVQSTPHIKAPVQATTSVAVVPKSTPPKPRHHRAATIPAPVTEVAELPAPGLVDTAGERVVASIDSEPFPNAEALKITADTRQVIRSVAAFDVPLLIHVDTLPGSLWGDIKNNVSAGTQRVLGAIKGIGAVITRRPQQRHIRRGLP